MKSKTSIAAVLLAAFLVLLLLGLWVGLFETFGGYVARQRAFLWASIVLGLLVGVLLTCRWKVHYVFSVVFFALSHVVYVLGQAVGQTLYVGFADAGDFVHILLLALNNQL